MTINDRTRFAGDWRKDVKASDSLDEASSLLQLSGMVRGALAKMNTIHIECDDHHFKTTTPLPKLLFIPLGSTVEAFPLSGQKAHHKRRDNRPGQFKGKLVSLPNGAFEVKSTWQEPLSGHSTDTYELSDDGNKLTIESMLNVEGRTSRYKTVYNRSVN